MVSFTVAAALTYALIRGAWASGLTVALLVVPVAALVAFVLAERRRRAPMPGLALVGIGAGLAMAPLSATAMAAVPGSRAGMAGGAISTFRQLGYAFGIAVLGELFRGGLARVAGAPLAGALGGGSAGVVLARSSSLSPLVHRAFATGLDMTFVVAAGLGLIAGVVVLVFVRPSATPAGVSYEAEGESAGRSRRTPVR